MTKEEKQPEVSEPAGQVLRLTSPSTPAAASPPSGPLAAGSSTGHALSGAGAEDQTVGILGPGIQTLAKHQVRPGLHFPEVCNPGHSTVLNKKQALQVFIEMDSASSGSLPKFRLITLTNF